MFFLLRCDVKYGQDSKIFELNEFRVDYSTDGNGIYNAPFVPKNTWEIGASVQVECKIKGKIGLTKVSKPEERNRTKRSADEQLKDFENAWPPELLINEEEDVGDFVRYVTGYPFKVKST